LTPEKTIETDSEHAAAIRPDRGYEHPCRFLPLLVVTGASGAGKPTVLHELVRTSITEGTGVTGAVVPLDSDAPADASAQMTDGAYRDPSLRNCANGHQSGRSVLMAGAETNPDDRESPVHRRIPAIHSLALVADDTDLAERLRARPDWPESHTREYVDSRLLQSGAERRHVRPGGRPLRDTTHE